MNGVHRAVMVAHDPCPPSCRSAAAHVPVRLLAELPWRFAGSSNSAHVDFDFLSTADSANRQRRIVGPQHREVLRPRCRTERALGLVRRIDILVNNPALVPHGTLLEIPEDVVAAS